MKYIKKFEARYQEENYIPTFEEGDDVFCIDAESIDLTYGKKYFVFKIIEEEGKYFCKVINDSGTFEEYYCDRFVNEIEFKEIKYNL